jgi:chemotaxis protein MotB
MALKFKKSQQKGAPPWLVSMGDMNNLLMCFFIVLMGEEVTTIGKEDITLIMSQFRGSIGVMEGGPTIAKGKLSEMGQTVLSLPASERKKAYSRTFKHAKELLKPEVLARTVRIREDERGLIITLASDSFFEPGKAALTRDTLPVLHKIANILNEVPNYIRIEGHTDNRPVQTEARRGGFATNWELSAARSVNVLRYFGEEEGITQKRMSAVAFGAQRPVDDNNTPEGRAYNRRVDIVILKEKEPPEVSASPGTNRPLPNEEWK